MRKTFKSLLLFYDHYITLGLKSQYPQKECCKKDIKVENED
nr:MAG TPA: hypothetical protein [Caudoviricetes sp.]